MNPTLIPLKKCTVYIYFYETLYISLGDLGSTLKKEEILKLKNVKQYDYFFF
jgi:hypothetical protein